MNSTRIATLALAVTLAATGCATSVRQESTAPDEPAVTATAPTTASPATMSASTTTSPSTTTDAAPVATAPAEPAVETPATGPAAEEPDPADAPDEPADEPSPEPEPGPAATDDLTVAPVEPDPDPGPDPVELEIAAVPTTTPPSPPVTIAPILVALPLADCGVVGAVPAGAEAVTTIVIDLDDDGQADTATTYHVALGDGAGWRLRTEVTGGPVDDIAIDGVGAAMARVLGAVQVDFDLFDPSTHEPELLVQVGSNSSGVNLGVFGLDEDGCLFRFQDELGDDLVLPIHDAIGTKAGVICDDLDSTSYLSRLGAEHVQGTVYNASVTPLVRQGQALVDGETTWFDIDADAQAGWLAAFGDLSCPGFEL